MARARLLFTVASSVDSGKFDVRDAGHITNKALTSRGTSRNSRLFSKKPEKGGDPLVG